MGAANYFKNCKGCACLDNDIGCLRGIGWLGGSVPKDAPCHTPILYRHPDGEVMISLDTERGILQIENEETGRWIDVPIAPRGMLALAQALIAEALKLEGRE